MRKIGFLKVYSLNSYQYKKNWISSVLLMIIEPAIYLAVFGYGVGKYINEINGKSYLEFFFIGYLCLTAAIVSMIDSFLTQRARLYRDKIYSSWLMTPISKLDIFLGETVWSSFKAMIAAFIAIVIGFLFGIQINLYFIPLFILLIPTAFLFACIGSFLAVSNLRQRTFGFHIFVILIASFFIAGAFFPLDSLNLPVLSIAYLIPLTHSIQISHLISDGELGYRLIGHIFYLFFSTYLVFRVSFNTFKEKILN